MDITIDTLKTISQQQEDIVGKLISFLETTDDDYLANWTAMTLADHFKDERIEPCLMNKIQNPKWKQRRGTLLFALECYSNEPKYLYFLIDLILKNENEQDGEIFMSAYGMLLKLHPPLNSKEIARALQRVRREEKKKNLNGHHRRVVHSLLDYLEGQREIRKFYKRFLAQEDC
ncbi:MAG: hypothetical protein LBR81_09470 [Prevotellaceae bacterium]|jgi:hypothetical protein|nr:hypothetical protein [Prevotellaceae bacterium]